MTINLSPQERRVVEARAIAKNVTEFSEILGICNKTVWRYYERYNLEPFPHGGHRKHPRGDEVCALFKAGKSMGDIGLKLGLTRGSVAGIIGRAGLFQKRMPRQAKPPKVKTGANRQITTPKFSAQPFRARVTSAPFLGIDLYQLTSQTCKNPDPKCDDPRTMTYCGQLVYGTLPYCAACASINYAPAQARYREARPR